jgi:glycerol-3-phosphate acyltransferase PlsY
MLGDDSFLNLPILEIIIGVSAVTGHVLPCFAGFKGGKGINTFAGMAMVIIPIELGIGVFIFILTVGISGYVSLASMIGSSMLPLVLFSRFNFFGVDIKGYFTLIYFVIGLVVVIFVAHRTNIVRLIKGTENRFEKMQFLRNCCKKKTS